MKRFRFPLRSVALVRSHEEGRAREALAAAVHAYVEAERDLAARRTRTAALADALFQYRGDQFVAAEAAVQFRHYRAEVDDLMKAEQALNTARLAMEQARERYIEAHRRLKVMQRLEERARQHHRAAQLRDEQAELDEIAGRRLSLGTS